MRRPDGCKCRVIRLEVVYFVHASTMRPSFLHTQTRNAQATHQNRKVTGTVNNIFNKASIGLRTFIAITQEASKVRTTALVVLSLQMDTSAGVWVCGTGSDVVIVAYYMTAKCTEGYRYREANGDFPIVIEFSGISQSADPILALFHHAILRLAASSR